MNKEIIIAKMKRQQAEIREMIAQLREDRRNKKIVDILIERCKETKKIIETLQEKSFFPKGVEELDVEPEVKEIERKVDKVKSGVKKMRKLGNKIKEIQEDISE
ncbi:MAG: hypothetical protein U9R31_02710 [Candidatus Omnitrophota bacterium]|nr:hypothetical protein [Candidatus Omnitrophota bacterium]